MDNNKNRSNNKEKTLIKNIFIYGVGNLASKLIAVLLFPLYTYYIDPTELGYFDITLTFVFLLVPFYTFQLRDGVFRFIIGADIDKKNTIYRFVFSRLFINTLLLIIIAIVLYFIYPVSYLPYIVALIIVNGILDIESFILRVESKSYFILANILSVLMTLLLVCLFLIYFDMNIEGVYLANIGGRLFALCIIEFRFRFMLSSVFNKRIANNSALNKELVRYSIMLIPLVISGFVFDVIGKLFIQHYLGIEQNGIYGISLKFMAILMFASIMFYQAWQETAIVEYNTPNRDEFFTKIFNYYSLIMSVIIGMSAIGLKIFYPYFIAETYQNSLFYVYPLSIAMFFFALSSFLDLGYQCAKQTSKSIVAIICSIIVCFIANFLLVKVLGLYGASIAYIITYLFLFIYRYHDTKRFFKIKGRAPSFIALILLVVFGGIFYSIDNRIILSIILFFIFFFSTMVLIKNNDMKKIYGKRSIK